MAPSVQRRKVWLTPTAGVPCSNGNAAKTRNPLKFVGVPHTNEPISAASGPKLTIVWGRVGEVLLFTKLFPIVNVCLSCKDIAPQSCPDGDFFAIFGVLHFQRAARSTFQTCILNLRLGHNMCESMVDIRSPTAEIRRGKERRKKKAEKTTG